MRHDLRHLAVDLHPAQCFAKRTSVGQGALHTGVCPQIVQTSLQSQDLVEALDIAAGERQAAKPRGGAVRLAPRRLGSEPEWDKQASKQNRIREPLRHRFVLAPVRIEGRERSPQIVPRPVV